MPTNKDIRALVATLPRLYAEGFQPVSKWHGGNQGKDGTWQLPYPEYDPLVEEFFRQVADPCWMDYGYRPEEAAKMLADPEFIRSAALPQIKRC